MHANVPRQPVGNMYMYMYMYGGGSTACWQHARVHARGEVRVPVCVVLCVWGGTVGSATGGESELDILGACESDASP